ncbi:hypothetical protein [Anaerotignum sp.]|uniref:hypothetical protein n=1 Tax=Anaerotignum sp. TaxID=2039241 RepID=UPI0028995CDF|nr:hypothetical protein [Anaerotignum sp.]
MSWQEHIIEAHLAVTNKVGHFSYEKSDRYFVWQEDGANDLVAGNIHAEKVVTGTTDLFTKNEFDPWTSEIEFAFDNSPFIYWQMNSVQYEENTGFYHYEWRWEVF